MSHQAECCYQSAASAAAATAAGLSAQASQVAHQQTTNGMNGTRVPVSANVFSPLERLEAMSSDYDMLKPLLMFNIENIQTYRADCKYRKARK